MLTREEIAQALPANLKSAATDQFTSMINNIALDPEVAEQVRNNFLDYSSVLKEGRYTLEAYLSAVTYVSFKMMDLTNHEAYAKTFPARYQRLLAQGTSSKDIAAYVHSYSKGKLVNAVMERCLIPPWVLNQDIFQKAINHQAYLMLNAESERVQQEAANSLLTHLKKPDSIKPTVNIDIKDTSGLNELKQTLSELAKKQIELIESGVGPKEIAASPLIEGEFTEV